MVTSDLEPPASDELEVSVFGPGYGESVVLHVGNGHWILVDSCLEPDSGRPAPLQYLHDLSVNVGQSVKLIVATHWHDDHVRGISSVLGECQSAKFAISGALDADAFLALLALYRNGGRAAVGSSGLDEVSRVFRILDARKQQGARLGPSILASSNKVLYRDRVPLAIGTVEASVFSLSPSDASLLRAELAFGELRPMAGERKKRVTSLSPNHAAVALWVQVGDNRLLLGSDLERTSDPGTGWSVILDDQLVASGEAEVFKVAHHGAESAHEPRVWSELLSEDPFALLSPFCKGSSPLPTAGDISRITGLTANAYITSPPRQRRHRWTNKAVRDLIGGATRDIRNVHSGWGHIRLRHSMLERSNSWKVELFGDACALRDCPLHHYAQ